MILQIGRIELETILSHKADTSVVYSVSLYIMVVMYLFLMYVSSLVHCQVGTSIRTTRETNHFFEIKVKTQFVL